MQIDRAREEFLEGRLGPTQRFDGQAICASDHGTADLGSRYIKLVEAFGAHGVLSNICGPQTCIAAGQAGVFDEQGRCAALGPLETPATVGMQRALDKVGDTILRRVARMCLPRRPLGCDAQDCSEASLVVRRHDAEGEEVDLLPASARGGAAPGTYLVRPDSTCDSGLALSFGDTLGRGDSITLRYNAAGPTRSAAESSGPGL